LRDRILKLYQVNGKTFTCLYLKETVRLISKSRSGETTSSSQEPRVACRRGLPLIIPGCLRLLIEDNDTRITRLTLTILSSYRSMIIPGQLKLETITSPFSGNHKTLPETASVTGILKEIFVEPFLAKGETKRLNLLFKGTNLISPSSRLLNLSSSGPNSKIQLFGYPLDALAFKENPAMLESFRIVSKYLGKDIYRTLVEEIKVVTETPLMLPSEYLRDAPLSLGRLAFKTEAAGKIRVFAIVDAWTQSLLFPLHDFLFKILKRIPQDGTFNQHAPMERLISLNLPFLGSYDLSAATDRLPIDLQAQVLEIFFNTEFSEH
jgi:hypothetical protein